MIRSEGEDVTAETNYQPASRIEPREIRFLKLSPGGRLFEQTVLVMCEDDWEEGPESREPDWDVVKYGRVVVAVRVVF